MQEYLALELLSRVSKQLLSKASLSLWWKCRYVATESCMFEVNYKEAVDLVQLNWRLCFQEMSGQQQQSSSVEAEFDFPKDDDAFSSSEFKEEGDFTEGLTESSSHAATGKQSLFEGYKDPSKQFSGHTRSYHQDARYGRFPCMCDFCLFCPVDPLLPVRQAFHWASPRLQPHSEQASVVTAVLPAAAQSAEDVPPGPHHRRRADGRWHWEGQTEQESWDKATQTGGKSVVFRL